MIRNLLLTAVMLVTIIPVSHSQVWEQWVTMYNGPGNNADEAKSLAIDDYGNVYVTGKSYGGSSGDDYATIKYNSAGVEQWVARYNGPGNSEDEVQSLSVDATGNVYVTGWSIGIGTSIDYTTIKYNSAGVEQWVARYDGSNSIDVANSIAVDTDGNVYVTGKSFDSNNDCVTIKYNPAGIQQWVARYDASNTDEGLSLTTDLSGNVYVTGGSLSYNWLDYLTIKYNSVGVEQWVASYNGPGNDMDEANTIAVDTDGNVYVTGKSKGSGTYFDYTTIKYNSAGVEQWVNRYSSGPGDYGDLAYDLAIDANCNVYVTGVSCGAVTGGDYTTIKYSPTGIQQWVAMYSTSGYHNDEAKSLAIDANCNVYVTGMSYDGIILSDYATIKYNSAGVEQWVARYSGGNGWELAYSIAVDDNGNVYVTGTGIGYGMFYDFITIKYNQTNPPYISLTPHNPPIQIPSTGGSFQFDLEIANHDTQDYNVNVWIDLTFPFGTIYTLQQYCGIDLPAGTVINRNSMTQFIPAVAPPGTYFYNAHIANRDTWELLDEDSFTFEKLAGDNSQSHDTDTGWQLFGWDEEISQTVILPTEARLHPATPNPFNPITMLSFTLAQPSTAKLIIYNLQGQEVARLLDKECEAGTHQLVFDASNLPSSIYLARLSTGHSSQTQKLLLIK